VAIAFIDKTEGASLTQNLSTTMPATVNADDYLLMFITTNWEPQSLSTPSGWTQLDTEAWGEPIRIWAFGKKAAGTEDGATVVFNGTVGSVDHGWACLRYSGVDTTTALDTATTSVSETGTATPTQNSQTTVTANAFVIGAFGATVGGTATSGTVGSSATERVDLYQNPTFLYVEELDKASAGAIALTFTATASTNWSNIQVALRPTGGAPPTPPALRVAQSNLRW
jgi:hypothetical protein